MVIKQWGTIVTNAEQGTTNTFTFPIAFNSNLFFYYAYDWAGYYYDVVIKNKNLNSCYIYGIYPKNGSGSGELAPTDVDVMAIFIGV